MAPNRAICAYIQSWIDSQLAGPIRRSGQRGGASTSEYVTFCDGHGVFFVAGQRAVPDGRQHCPSGITAGFPQLGHSLAVCEVWWAGGR